MRDHFREIESTTDAESRCRVEALCIVSCVETGLGEWTAQLMLHVRQGLGFVQFESAFAQWLPVGVV